MTRPGPDKTKAPHIRRRCHRCHGTGRYPCQICRGTGQVSKGTDLRGRPQVERCGGCFGNRTTRCASCGGEGYI